MDAAPDDLQLGESPIRLLYAFLCREAGTTDKAAYVYGGVTHFLLPDRYPAPFAHLLVSCWLLDRQPHRKRVELWRTLDNGSLGCRYVEVNIPAAPPESKMETYVSVVRPEDLPLTLTADTLLTLKILLDGEERFNCPILVQQVGAASTNR
jgi:hypothetical protein